MSSSGAPPTSGRQFILVSSDAVKIPVSEKICKMSTVLSDMMSCCGDSREIQIPDIEGQVLQTIVDFCRHYEDEVYVPPRAGDPENRLPTESDWGMQFLKRTHAELMKILNGANYLHIQRLIDSYCYRLHRDLLAKTDDELREIFAE